MHGVAVGEQDTAGELVPRTPQRVGVVPLERLGVEDGPKQQAVALRQRLETPVDPLSGEAHPDHASSSSLSSWKVTGIRARDQSRIAAAPNTTAIIAAST